MRYGVVTIVPSTYKNSNIIFNDEKCLYIPLKNSLCKMFLFCLLQKKGYRIQKHIILQRAEKICKKSLKNIFL